MFLFELSFRKPTPFELKKSFFDKNTVLSYKKDGYNHHYWAQLKFPTSRVPNLMHKLLKFIFTC